MASQPDRSPTPPVSDDDLDLDLDLDDPRLIPACMREKVAPAVAFAQLETSLEAIRSGRAVGIDGDAFLIRMAKRLSLP